MKILPEQIIDLKAGVEENFNLSEKYQEDQKNSNRSERYRFSAGFNEDCATGSSYENFEKSLYYKNAANEYIAILEMAQQCEMPTPDPLNNTVEIGSLVNVLQELYKFNKFTGKKEIVKKIESTVLIVEGKVGKELKERHPNVEVITTTSPLGTALLGANQGETVTYKAKYENSAKICHVDNQYIYDVYAEEYTNENNKTYSR